MSDDRLAQARAEAERRWRKGDEREAPVHFAHQVGCIKGFTQGVQWADDNPQPCTITADQCNDIEDAVHEGVPLGHMLRRLGIEVRDE